MTQTPIALDRTSATALYRQIYDQIKEAILNGRLLPGARLPSSRSLAASLEVGRITVTTAYDRLAGEGYAESRAGAGTSVASTLPAMASPGLSLARLSTGHNAVQVPPRVTEFVRNSRDVVEGPARRVEFDFRFMGEAFPMVEWRRMLARHWSSFDVGRLITIPSQGDVTLRTQIAQYLRTARGARCTEEQILVTSGVEHAFDLVAHLLLDSSDTVIMEDPCVATSRLTFQAHGARVVPVAVDRDGIDPSEVERVREPGARLLCVMPSHQYPTGATLSLSRRLGLLEWAVRTGTAILENDQYSEYRYGDAVLESMQGLDTSGVVLYVGTFQRLVGSAVPVGYLVVPPALLPMASALHAGIEVGPPPFVQAALAEFMASGLFARHQRRLQLIHQRRRDALICALHDEFGEDVVVGPARAGHHLHVSWRSHPATDALIACALRAGVGLRSVRPLYLAEPPADPGVTMAYGGLDEETIRRGVTRLGEVLATT